MSVSPPVSCFYYMIGKLQDNSFLSFCTANQAMQPKDESQIWVYHARNSCKKFQRKRKSGLFMAWQIKCRILSILTFLGQSRIFTHRQISRCTVTHPLHQIVKEIQEGILQYKLDDLILNLKWTLNFLTGKRNARFRKKHYNLDTGQLKGWSQNRVKIFYLYNVKIEGGGGLRIFVCKDSNS